MMKIELGRYFAQEDVVLVTRQLKVDLNREFGQVRQLSAVRVQQRKVDLRTNPPGRLIQLYVWQEPGVLLFLIYEKHVYFNVLLRFENQ